MIMDANPWSAFSTRFGISVVEGGPGDALRATVGQGRNSGDTFAIGNIYHSGSTAQFQEGLGCAADGTLYLLSKGTMSLRINNGDDLVLSDNEFNVTDFTNCYLNRVTAVSFATFSDARLKDNVATIENGLQKINSLRGVEFTQDGEDNIGVIAQEVEPILPQIVKAKISSKGHFGLDPDEVPEEGFKTVEYDKIVAVLIEAVKELDNKYTLQIEDLKSEVNKLKGDS